MRTELREHKQPLTVRNQAGRTTIGGYGAVFYREGDPGTEYELFPGLFERIDRNAFARAVGRDDVRSYFNHDENFVLGRTSSGTLSLAVDDRGLRYEVDPPGTQTVREQVITPIERGDVDGSSFMFVVRKDSFTTETRGDSEIDVRNILDLDLWEVGPVAMPAYSSATSGIRSAIDRRDAPEYASVYDRWQAYRKYREYVQVQTRMAEVDVMLANRYYL